MLADEVRQFLAQRKIFLNTDLGQHFLIAEEVLDVILAAGDVGEDDTVVEIGPGIGILTRELVGRAKTVRAVEIDPRMSMLLPQFVGDEHKDRLHVVTENANVKKSSWVLFFCF
jgi:16S rRNA (adenine1518-N6/adenine1519-N6)-dimethyltransferase